MARRICIVDNFDFLQKSSLRPRRSAGAVIRVGAQYVFLVECTCEDLYWSSRYDLIRRRPLALASNALLSSLYRLSQLDQFDCIHPHYNHG